jgi:hypothetical protein
MGEQKDKEVNEFKRITENSEEQLAHARSKFDAEIEIQKEKVGY